MKNIIWIAFLLVSISCSKKSLYVLDKNQPIVDLPTNPEFYNKMKSFNASMERQEKQTIYLFKNKEIKKNDIQKLFENKKVNLMEMEVDSKKIENLGFDSSKVKKVYIFK
ncbi:hypothetical protein [Frigoriflavimonas asaccharolytica]|uniref:Lipoprotein n=1 Tax=Frigoriflavimonas asaccharolytica TaxID=2735899 RepID=A0A8J8G4E8_9FLAO|nr:hypothetical protein [Frigoriflavimonas asaccharolytica]NRS91106.1 hypothetical protein [Frigoriflavimonas asaccharolytica]